MTSIKTMVVFLALSLVATLGTALAADHLDQLSQVDIFKGLSKAQLEKLAGVVQTRKVKQGDFLIRLKTPVSQLFALRSGAATVRLADGKIAQRVKPGIIVGELELVSGKPATADVFMDSDGEVMIIDYKALRPLMDADPAMGYRIMENIAIRISGY